jgi:RND family efflux transporter MFP subunit
LNRTNGAGRHAQEEMSMENRERERRGRGRRIVWITAAVVVALFALRFWMLSGKKSYASISSIQEQEGKPVEIVAAGTGDLESWTSLSGTVEGSFQYPVVSTNSISVTDVAKKEGDRVKPGDVLIRLEKTAPNAMLLSYNRSLALYQDALADVERMRNLYAEGAVSKQALDKAELALEVARSDLANARESTNLIATHAGVVTSVLIKSGEMASAYEPLMWVARTDSVRVSFEAGSRQAMVLRPGQKAVWRSTMNGGSATGVISRLDLSADPSSHLFSGEALFPNADRNLMPGILISFDVLSGQRRGVVKIPTNALIEREGAYHVFVAAEGEGGALHARLVVIKIGLMTSDEVEVVSGLKGGDRVIVFGQTLLEDGDLVKIVRGGGAR